MADIAHDALQYCKMRTLAAKKGGGKDARLVLTTEDLSNALKNYGVTVMKTDALGPAGTRTKRFFQPPHCTPCKIFHSRLCLRCPCRLLFPNNPHDPAALCRRRPCS